MSDNIKVVVKVRPLISREIEEKLSYQWRVNNNTLHQLDHFSGGASYTFDKVYDENTDTQDVYNDVAKPIVEAASAGINGTIFAYGQTSSGKTYTMTGTAESPGIITLAVLNLFDIIKSKDDRDFLLRVSYMEIYNEQIRDLLDPTKDKIKIHDSTKGGGRVDVTEKVTSSPEEVFYFMKQTIESRQHTEGDGTDGCVNVSTLNLVDLAGSERSGQTGATGKRFKEGTHINKSLSALALVIKQLSEDPNKYVNYRDSKLTRILQNSLGGNAKTSIICAVTPAAAEETISTLQFANRAKAIKNKPEVNEVTTNATMIQQLTKKLSKLQSLLENKMSLEQDNQMLQEKIETLQRQILNGFGGHSISSELSKADRRRTWAAPRRMTIDTLHTIEESPGKPVQRFCTPALKYNPSTINVPDFLPLNKMPRVSEESVSGQVTPSPHKDRKVNFSDEVIELESSKTPPCILREQAKKAEKNYQDIVELTEREKIYKPDVVSILREQMYKLDIVNYLRENMYKLDIIRILKTEMYKPDIVELMEKMEQNTNIMAQLEEQVNVLSQKVEEKDSEIDLLKVKISEAEHDIKTISSEKINIQSTTEKEIKKLNTELTDLEVMYETLKRKSKTREDDLLEQLNEIRMHQGHRNNGKSLSRTFERDNLNFMDLSKDISLVNSDIENSTGNDEASAPLNDLLVSLNSQLSSKTELVLELEAKLHSQQKEMLGSESSNETMKVTIASLNEKLNAVENENAILRSSIDNLNSTIKSLSENLATANSDNDSYNILINDLQLRIKEQDKTSVILDDSALEAMIANEEKFIANNENLKNIIRSLKVMVDARNSEIMTLKAAIPSKNSSPQLHSEIESKQAEVNVLEIEVGKLKQQLNEKFCEIKKLTEENNSLTRRCEMHNDMQVLKNRIEILNKENEIATSLLERTKDESKILITKFENGSAETKALVKEVDSLNQQLSNVTTEKDTLTHLKTDFEQELEKLRDKMEMTSKARDDAIAEANLLKSESYTIKTALSNYQLAEAELAKQLEELQNEVGRLSQKISGLETEIGDKEKEILTLRECQLSQEHTNIVSTATDKILAFISRLTGKTHDNPNISNIEVVVQSLSYCADSLAETAEIIEAQRDLAAKSSSELLSRLENDTNNHQNVISALEAQVETLMENKETDRGLLNELTGTSAYQLNEIEKKTKEINELNQKLQATTSDVEKLKKALEYKDQAVISAEQKVSELLKETENLTMLLKERECCDLVLRQQVNLNASYLEVVKKGYSQDLITEIDTSNNTSSELVVSLPDIYVEVIGQMRQLTGCIVHRDKVLKNILDKLASLINTIKIENKSNVESGDNNVEKFNEIPEVLDKVAVHIKMMEQDLSERDEKLDKSLKEANANICDLKSITVKVQNELYDYKENYLKAIAELDAINRDNKSLNSSLLECNELLETLQAELASKGYELESIEKSTRQFKSKFTDLDHAMKEKIKYLETDNDKLRRQLETMAEQQNDDARNISKDPRKSLTATLKQAIGAPRSLTSISLERVIEVMAANDWRNDASSSESAHSLFDYSNKGSSEFCEYNTYTLNTELNEVKEDNAKLKDLVELLKAANKKLIEEQHEVRKEVNLLLEPAMELQKKIGNHRTNLSTLTATTYAENKALQSQVKVLQHYHRRFHNVVQKDIPSLKERLRELFGVLKMEAENNPNNSFKRFSLPDVLDKNNTVTTTFRNDSTLDGDLLMIDTNVTLASVDGTLVGHEQDFDSTQIDPEATYNSNLDLTTIDQNLVRIEIEKLTNENQKMHESLEILQRENKELKEQVNTSKTIDTQKTLELETTPNKSLNSRNTDDNCDNCKDKAELISQLNQITDELNHIKEQKSEIDKKYKQLELEMPSSESLMRKQIALEKEQKNNVAEITSLKNALLKKNSELKQLQEEHDTLSNQFMESITEVDDLRKDIDDITKTKSDLEKQCFELKKTLESSSQNAPETCPQCLTKKKSLREFSKTESVLCNSQKNMDTSLRHSTICTLQNELQASREDCKKITEEFATIKNQLERSNISMNQTMDDSLGESNIFSFTKDFDSVDTQTTSKFTANMPNILEERLSDIYTMDKSDCLNYFIEKTGAEKENLDRDVKIIDVMKMLYNNLMTHHSHEVDNLFNKLRNLEDSNTFLENQLSVIKDDYVKVRNELDDKTTGIASVTKTLEAINHNINTMKGDLNNSLDSDNNTKLVAVFKENILKVLDREFTLSTTFVFESLIDSIATKHQTDLSSIMEKYTKLQEHMENLMTELTAVNENLHQMKEQLTEREKDYSLLKAQKDKVYEISNAVTLDIIKKEQELSETITKGCRKLLDYNIIDTTEVDLSLPPKKNVGFLFEFLIQKHTSQEKSEFKTEKEKLLLELANSKSKLQQKEVELENMRSENDKNKEIHRTISQDLIQKERELKSMQSLREEYEKALSDQNNKASMIQKLKDEITTLEEMVATKQTLLHDLEKINEHKVRNIDSQLNELATKVKESECEISMLRSANEALSKEKEEISLTLAKSNENINSQKNKLEHMTKELEKLQTSLNESARRVETLQHESKSILEENKALKDRISRLELNNKTHEKSVEIQSRMIKRLQNQKEEEADKYSKLKAEFDTLQDTLKQTKEELNSLQTLKNSLEIRVTELEAGSDGVLKSRLSIDAINSNISRRRQSIHDSKRQFGQDNNHDHSKAESIFSSRSKPDDLFMDCEDDSSNRSTPARSAKRRDSSLAKTDQSSDEPGSRPSSVAATRIRRQSIHDLHRSVVHTPSPRESLLGSLVKEELENMETGTTNDESDVAKLKTALANCRQELEDLKERYRELDEECETCAEYLHERDEQCFQLKKEKSALEDTIAELKESLGKCGHNQSGNITKRSFANASVNTDEDWTNLHAVVVDRMSFDAEVEKNKKLTRAVEEFRLKNRELKAINGKMHKALDKYAEKDHHGVAKELEETRQELESCKQELAELQRSYKELDEECDTCAAYLRERDEQILELKEAKFALEKKLHELQEAGVSQSARKKRQSLHDQNRTPQPDLTDATTETSDDFLSYQVERDGTRNTEAGDSSTRDVQRLTQMVETLSSQKAFLEQQVIANQVPLYVATGSAIVQNQQITDVMKENQKLKKINAKLMTICKKRGKSHPEESKENEADQG